VKTKQLNLPYPVLPNANQFPFKAFFTKKLRLLKPKLETNLLLMADAAIPGKGDRVGEATCAIKPYPHQFNAFQRLYQN